MIEKEVDIKQLKAILKQEKECLVCMNKVGKEDGVQLDCGHDSFHLNCVKSWVESNGHCPCCRSEVSDKVRHLMGIEI